MSFQWILNHLHARGGNGWLAFSIDVQMLCCKDFSDIRVLLLWKDNITCTALIDVVTIKMFFCLHREHPVKFFA